MLSTFDQFIKNDNKNILEYLKNWIHMSIDFHLSKLTNSISINRFFKGIIEMFDIFLYQFKNRFFFIIWMSDRISTVDNKIDYSGIDMYFQILNRIMYKKYVK